jgi:Mn-dependent DtxR family transcriptional regulator
MISTTEPIDADVLRIRHEYLELPGLQLTVRQVSRLLGVSAAHAATMLADLEREGFLELTEGRQPAVYRRRHLLWSH